MLGTVYLAGPMSGIPDYNFPAFHAAAERLRRAGLMIVDPAENFDGDQSLPWAVYLAEAIRQVTYCDAIAVLPGWRTSRGARLELRVGLALGLSIVDAETLGPVDPGGYADLIDVLPEDADG